MTDEAAAGSTAQTPRGPMQYLDEGRGAPVLFVHGSPGGSDQGRLMGAFLVARGYRVVSPSRPGYHGTPLTDDNAAPEQQAEMELALMASITGDRRDGLRNDQRQFPKIGDLGLASITTPTLLVHATTDADVPISHSEHAANSIPGAELVRVEGGTHVSVWTDPGSADLQARIAGHLDGHVGG